MRSLYLLVISFMLCFTIYRTQALLQPTPALSGKAKLSRRLTGIRQVPLGSLGKCTHVSLLLQASRKQDEEPRKDTRRIVKYDNLGDPIYEDEGGSDGNGISVLGMNVNVDPITSSLLIFGLIAFNFFVLANL